MQTIAGVDPLHYFIGAALVVAVVSWVLLHGQSDEEDVAERQRLDVQNHEGD